MSTKRKFAEDDDAIHPSRQAQIVSSRPAAFKKPRNFAASPKPPKKQAHASSVNLVKKKIRDVTRRLERSEDLPADVRAEDERALAAYQQELAEAENEKVKQAMIKRYHMVRFFERQKATRMIKRLRKALTSATENSEVVRLTKELRIAGIDLNYTQYSPLNEVYVSIYPSTTAEDYHKDESKKPETWHEVERRMADGGLDQLRNGIRTMLVSGPKPKSNSSGANGEVHAKPTRSAKETWSGSSDPGGVALAKAPSKPMSLPKRMTDDEFFKLNRRQKREALRKSGVISTGLTSSKDLAGTDVEDDDISDGGFFEEERF